MLNESCQLTVYDLPPKMTDTACRDLFSQMGPLRMLNLIRNSDKESPEFGNITMGYLEYEKGTNLEFAVAR